MKFASVITLFTLFFACDTQRILLSGTWDAYLMPYDYTIDQLTESRIENGTYFQATVPGGVYSDLVDKKIIPENLVGDNDVKNRWVSNHTYRFTKKFFVDQTILQARSVKLTFYGVDTFAGILLNRCPIEPSMVTLNMFVRYQFDVTLCLMPGQNELMVLIYSPVKIAKELYNEQSQNYSVPPECVPEIYNGECHVNHIRKMQASFAWDWGPAFPSIGIWKDVELEAVNQALLMDATTSIYRGNNNSWNIVITAFLSTASSDSDVTTVSGHLRSFLDVNGNNVIQNESLIAVPLNGQGFNASIVLTANDEQVDRWWPNGYGDQPMYRLTVEIELDKRMSQDFYIGFRTVELVQEPLTKGESFYFKINDVPIFAKGSNWIPSNVLPELSADKETVRDLLRSAKEANMNMLRVWGGGYYESNLFYQLADQYGIMIWQDFMFACGMYPTSDEFLESVREEVRQNVMRLQHHPSVVVWAGNNENEAALYGNWYGTGDKTIYKQDYVKLYVGVIKTEVEILDPTTPFVVSSPSDGAFTEKHNYLGPNPYSNLYGDVHYYNYILNGWDINQYPRTRFASEYGVQSIPSIATLKSAITGENDLKINSAFMKHRQHLLGGYESMEHLVAKNLYIPQTENATQDFIDYVYLTQINQAVSIKTETESYRQARSDLNPLGEGMTMGALYWQLNDVWQAPSWSSIDFLGRWKMLHYYAVEFFSPVIITPHVSPANELELYIVSDKLTETKNCSFAVNTYKWNSLTPIQTKSYSGITTPSNAAKMIASFWLDDYLQQAGCGGLATMRKKCVLEFVLTDESGKRIAPYNYVYPVPLKSVALPRAAITVKVSPNPADGLSSQDANYTIELRANEIALFVWLDFDSNLEIRGRFSENGFHMFHGIQTVIFHAKGYTEIDKIREYLRVTTLSDIYKRGGRRNVV